MIIGIHDAEKEHMKRKTFPNLALMKLAAWHKSQKDQVEWWNPLGSYNRIYSSKVLDFTPEPPIFLLTPSVAGPAIRAFSSTANCHQR